MAAKPQTVVVTNYRHFNIENVQIVENMCQILDAYKPLIYY